MDGQAVDAKLMKSISSTKKVLGKHISKPVLADKYLARPPFRFLLEIVNNVIQQTSFMTDVFAAKELKYDEVSSAEEKRAVLKRVIEAIENETGEKCTARTSKILSGKEPDKTNEMLQLLAKAISSFSSKSKRKVTGDGKKATTVVEKEATSCVADDDDGCKSKSIDHLQISPPPPSKIDDDGDDKKRETNGKDEGDPQKKSEQVGKNKPTASPSPVVSKKSSTTTAATASSNAKRKSSSGGGEEKTTLPVKSKTSLVKTNVSSSLTKESSKDNLKSKVGSPSTSASTLTLAPPRKVSNTNVPKSQHSRHSLSSSVKSTSSKVQILPEPVKIQGKDKQQDENLQKSLSKDKLQQKCGDVKAALPPETTADVPLQRPVTRTKYRQKTNESEDTIVEDKVVQEKVQEKNETASTTISSSPGEVYEDDNKAHVLKNDKKECGGGCGLRSGQSSSSEDVVTEHMNLKISEWKSVSQERIQQQQQPREQGSGLTETSNKTGWIADDDGQQVGASTKAPIMKRVFDSVENCSVVDNDNRATGGQIGRVPATDTPKPSRGEEANSKVSKRPVTVLRDNESGDEDDETFLVQEKIDYERDMTLERQSVLLMNGPKGIASSSSVTLDITYLPPEQRGLLVNQIMETQRELEKLSSGHQHHHHCVMEYELAERDKAAVREVYLKQIEDLREAIQKMSKCANPLANIVQRSQDDSCLMEIEFRKLKHENERLQKEIDGAKGETSRILFPLTQELTQLDTRIEKVEGAIVLAKQRLALIDSEYAAEFIAQLENTPTVDEAQGMPFHGETDPILQFRGNFPPDDNDDNDATNVERGNSAASKTKSLMDVFKRAVDMHQGSSSTNDGNVIANVITPIKKNIAGCGVTPIKSERRLLNRTVYGDYSPLGQRTNRILHQLEKEQPLDKENKPSWWD